MTAIAQRFHSIEADGPWTAPPFPPAERRHIMQAVIDGFSMGRPRWAEDLDGNFIYGLDATGKDLQSPLTYSPKPAPRRRGSTTDNELTTHRCGRHDARRTLCNDPEAPASRLANSNARSTRRSARSRATQCPATPTTAVAGPSDRWDRRVRRVESHAGLMPRVDAATPRR